jgi:hypothetical protein
MWKLGRLLPGVLAAAFSSPQDQDFSRVQIKVTKVAGNVDIYLVNSISDATSALWRTVYCANDFVLRLRS